MTNWAELRDRFAICPLIHNEIDVGGFGLVGLAKGSNDELRLNVTSAVIAYTLGYKSIDRIKKELSNDLVSFTSHDTILKELVQNSNYVYDSFYQSFQPRKNARIGIFAFDLAMVRARTSLELITASAVQGFLLEPCLMARALLEQFAYAFHVWPSDRDDVIFKTEPQSRIGSLKQVITSAGKAYGLLSKLAHYDPKMHYTFIGGVSEDPYDTLGYNSTVVQRSWQFKIAASCWIFYLLDVKYRLFKACYGGYEQWEIISCLENTARESFEEYFRGVDFPSVRQVRSMIS